SLAAQARYIEGLYRSLHELRNVARDIPFRHAWVFHLHPSEQMTPELRLECCGATSQTHLDGFFATPKVIWDDRWIRHCSPFPQPEARFVRAAGFEFVADGIRVRAAPRMRTGHLCCTFLHDVSRGGPEEWIRKQHQALLGKLQRQYTKSPRWQRFVYALPG